MSARDGRAHSTRTAARTATRSTERDAAYCLSPGRDAPPCDCMTGGETDGRCVGLSVADGDLVAVGCGDGWRVGLRVTSYVGLWVGRPRVGFHVSDGRGVCSTSRVGRSVWAFVGRGVWSFVGRGVWWLDVARVPAWLGVAWSSLFDDDDEPPLDFDDFLDAAVLSSPSSLLDLSPLLLPEDCVSARANERVRKGCEERVRDTWRRGGHVWRRLSRPCGE